MPTRRRIVGLRLVLCAGALLIAAMPFAGGGASRAAELDPAVLLIVGEGPATAIEVAESK